MKKIRYINLWAGVGKISQLSNRNETKWSKTNLFAYVYSYKSPKVTMTGNNKVYNAILKNGKKDIMENTYAVFLRHEILKAQ